MQAFEPFSPISCAPKIPYSSSATPATNRVPSELRLSHGAPRGPEHLVKPLVIAPFPRKDAN